MNSGTATERTGQDARSDYRVWLARYPSLIKHLELCLASFARRGYVSPGGRFSVLNIGSKQGQRVKYADIGGIDEHLHWHGIDTADSPSAKGSLTKGERQFDIVVSEALVKHPGQAAEVVHELSQVTRGGGFMIICVAMRPYAAARLRHFIGRTDGFAAARHSQPRCMTPIINKIESTGDFRVVAAHGFQPFSRGMPRLLVQSDLWNRITRSLGRQFPFLCPETQMLVQKQPELPTKT